MEQSQTPRSTCQPNAVCARALAACSYAGKMLQTEWELRTLRAVWLVLGIFIAAASLSSAETPYKYVRVGAAADIVTVPKTGYALMGGGADLDEAFRWLCERAHGGDFLILRATGRDDYNPYAQKLCRLNSVATLILPSRQAASDPFVAETIDHAEAIFIAGGDQANYIRFWTGTPVQAAINAAIKRGVPIGGTSAGLAVMGEWAYSAEGDNPENPNLDSKTALANPLGQRVTLVHGFLDIPVLIGIITDTHFVKRDRMGRLLAFLSRIQSSEGNEAIHGIGIDEGAAVLVEPDGKASIVGKGTSYFLVPLPPAAKLLPGKPLNQVFYSQRVGSGSSFDIPKWCCGESPEDVIVEDGRVRRLQDSGPVH